MSDIKISKLRRKLLIASAATPVVATLKSGAAMAASSAVCPPVKDVSNMKFPTRGKSITGDTAVRISVPTWEKNKATGATESRYIYEIEGQLYHHSGYPFDGKLDNYTKLPEDEQAHVLMLYSTDDSGTYEVGPWPKWQLDDSSLDGNYPINASCLTSIMVTSSHFSGL